MIGKPNQFAALMLVSFCTPHEANAGLIRGPVANVIVRQSDGLSYVEISGTETGRPVCGVTTTYFMIKDENSQAGKTQLAILLSAKLSGQTVEITGTGTCIRWIDGEDIEIVNLVP